MENKNLKLWNLVEKTNPNYTKQANVKGNKITSIAPQFQILNATAQFGIYGVTWGFRDIEVDYTLVPVCGLVYWKAIFFFPDGEFPATNSISIWRNNEMTKADDQFAKKVETDSLTKCLSKLGFNADIFLGKFDNDRYLEEVKEEFKAKPKLDAIRFNGALVSLKEGSVTKETILKTFELTETQEKQLNKV